jgi:hypothetical protein
MDEYGLLADVIPEKQLPAGVSVDEQTFLRVRER